MEKSKQLAQSCCLGLQLYLFDTTGKSCLWLFQLPAEPVAIWDSREEHSLNIDCSHATMYHLLEQIIRLVDIHYLLNRPTSGDEGALLNVKKWECVCQVTTY